MLKTTILFFSSFLLSNAIAYGRNIRDEHVSERAENESTVKERIVKDRGKLREIKERGAKGRIMNERGAKGRNMDERENLSLYHQFPRKGQLKLPRFKNPYIKSVEDDIIEPNLDTIDNVYFINLDKSKDRRKFMESWLHQIEIPYQRIPASQGPLSNEAKDNRCVEGKNNPNDCRSMVGLRDSNINIIDNYNVSGMTMVLEDDVAVDIPSVLKILHLVPSNWDVLRLDCKCGDTGPKSIKAERYINNVTWDTEGRIDCKHGTIFQTTFPSDKSLWYCGGTHAAIWRSDRLYKLRELWMTVPVNDIDCMLSTNKLTSYCVQGSVVTLKKFNSTIPKSFQLDKKKKMMIRRERMIP